MKEQAFHSFDYLKITVEEDLYSKYIDGYEKFGWKLDENAKPEKGMGKVTLYLKRSRHIMKKTELIRLQRHYEACMNEISSLKA